MHSSMKLRECSQTTVLSTAPCLHNGLPLDQDVYDAAEWSSLVELTEVSINHGSMPVVMPDFTRGEWNKLDGLHFALLEEEN